MKKGFNFGYFVVEGCRSIVSHGLMSFAAVCMIVACLIIMGSFSLLGVNVDHMLGDLEDDNEFLAYIDENYTSAQISSLIGQVEALDNVASVTFVSKEEAKAKFLEGHENSGLYASLPDTVLRDRLSIHVKDLERFSETVQQVYEMPGVVNYRAESEIVNGFIMVRSAVTALATVLVVILAAVSLFIIANTIRLATFTRREEIAIMKMCGATNWFIRWPFIVEGLVLGILGAVIAFFLQWLIYVSIYQAVARSGAITLFELIPFSSIAGNVLAVFLSAGGVIGAAGSVLAIRRFLQV